MSEPDDSHLGAIPLGLAGLASLCCVGLATLAGSAVLGGGAVAGVTAVTGGAESFRGFVVTALVTALTVGVVAVFGRWRGVL